MCSICVGCCVSVSLCVHVCEHVYVHICVLVSWCAHVCEAAVTKYIHMVKTDFSPALDLTVTLVVANQDI